MSHSDLENEIIDAVQSCWDADQKGILLSTLGLLLSNKGLWSKRPEGESLSKLIKSNLSDTLRIENHPQHRLVKGVFPKSATLTDPLIQYFDLSRKDQRLPRYHPRFWAAFSKEIAAGNRRFLNIDTIMFEDLPGESNAPTNASVYELTPEMIPNSDVEDRNDGINASIKAWAGKNKVDLPPLMASSRRTLEGRDRGRQISILDQMLDALSEKDMVRVQMPLDIVNKLRNRRGDR